MVVGKTCRRITYVFFIVWQQPRADHSCVMFFINAFIVNIEGKPLQCMTVSPINQSSGMVYYCQL